MDLLSVPKNWSIKLHSNGISYYSPSYKQASSFLDKNLPVLKQQAQRFGGVVHIWWRNCHQPFAIYPFDFKTSCLTNRNIMTHQIIQPARSSTSSLFIGNMQLSASLLPVLDFILSNPERQLGLVRVHDNAQLVVSGASTQAIKIEGTETVKRKTSDFWLASETERLNQAYRLYGGGEFELTYIASIDKVKYDPTAQWGRFTTRYRLVEDDFGIVYRQAEWIDIIEIPTPAVIV